MSQFKQNKVIHRVNSTASSGGTLTLVFNSARYQQITGTQSHTVVLPDATTLPKGIAFVISNRGTGTVTVNYNGGSLAGSLSANSQKTFIVFDNATSLGDWDVSNESGAGGGGGASVSSVDKLSALAGLSDSSYQDAENYASKINVNPEEISADVWITKTSLSVSKAGPGNIALNGFIYAPGGNNGSNLSDNQRYDDTNNYWLSRASLNVAKYTSASFSVNSAGYYISGFNGSPTSDSEKYLDSTNAWSTITAYPNAVQNPAGFVLNSYGFVAGGNTGAASAVVYMYDDTANAWRLRTPLSTARYAHAGFSLNGYGYVATGVGATSEKFSDSANSWSTVASVNSSNLNVVGFSVNGFGFKIGGNASNVVEQYSDFSNSWMTKKPMQTNRAEPGAESMNGAALAYGGDGPLSSVESYKNASFYTSKIVKKSKLSPTALFVSSALNDLVISSPIRMRTDGNQWRYLESNKDSALKTDETLKTKFVESQLYYIAAGYDGGGNGLSGNEFYNDSANTWVARTALLTARAAPANFKAEGSGYTVAGASNTTPANSIASVEQYSDILNTSTSKASITTARIYSFGVGLLGLGYVMGGWDTSTSYLTSAYKYTPSSNTWSAIAVLSSGRIESGTSALHDSAYVTGGYIGGPIATHERFNPLLGTWVSRTAVPVATGAPCNFTLGEKYYTCGGFAPSAVTTVRSYDDQSDAFTTKTSLTTSRYGAGPASVHGFGYVAVGNGGGTSVEKYNDAVNSWSTVASVSAARDYPSAHGAGAYRNYEIQVGIPAYIAGLGGGAWITKASTSTNPVLSSIYPDGFGYVSTVSTSERYSPADNTWRASANPTTSLNSSYAFNIVGFGYIGGTSPSGSTAIQQFNPYTVVWSAKTASSSSHGQNMGDTLNGYGYTPGGGGSNGNTSMEQYNQATDSWASKATMSVSRYASGITSNGRFYVYGGGAGTDATTEVYNDASNAWTTMASLPVARYNCGTVLRKSGNILICGNNGGNQSEVQEYNPAVNTYATRSSLTSAQAQPGRFNNEGILTPGFVSLNVVQQYVESLNNVILGLGLRVTES